MKNPNSFGQLLGTSTLLVFALSFNAYNIQASERGAFNGGDFLYSSPQKTIIKNQILPPKPRGVKMMKKQAQVLGYTTTATIIAPGLKGLEISNPPIDPMPEPISQGITDWHFVEAGWGFGNDHIYALTSFKTNLPAIGEIHYCLAALCDNPIISRGMVEGTEHTIDFGYLPFNTKIFYRYAARDSSDAVVTQPADDWYSFTTPANTTDLSITELTKTIIDSDSAEVYWQSTNAAGNGEYQLSDTMGGLLNGEPWISDGVVNGLPSGHLFGSKVRLDNLTAHDTYYIIVRKWVQWPSTDAPIDKLYGPWRSTDILLPPDSSTQCAQAGLRADIYGGPNHVCCAGLVLQGGVCNVPQTTLPDFIVTDLKIEKRTGDTDKYIYVTLKNTGAPITQDGHILSVKIEDVDTGALYFSGITETYPTGWTKEISSGTTVLLKTSGTYRLKATVDNIELIPEANESNNSYQETISIPTTQPDRVTVCHKTGSGYTEIETNQSGWTNGHSQHEGDYIKTSLRPCRAPKVTVEPLSSVAGPTIKNSGDAKNALIKRLQERIKGLKYTLSKVEMDVVTREKSRQTKTDTSLTNQLAGRLLIQPEEKGEVWYVDPVTKSKFFLKDGGSAKKAMEALSTGISETDFTKLNNPGFAKQLKGKILLRVEVNKGARGEAYYIDKNGQANYLKDGAAAYKIMKDKALGITNKDLSKVPTASLAPDTTTVSE